MVIATVPNSCISASQAKMQKLQHGERTIVSVRFTPDGKEFISASIDGTVVLWDSDSKTRLREISLDSGVGMDATRTVSQITDMDLSPDGGTIALAYSRDRIVGNRLEGKRENRIGLFDLRNGQEQRVFMGHTGLITAIDFSPDGRLLVSASGDRTAKLWDVSTGEQTLSISLKERGAAVTFSPDGKLIAVATQATFGKPPQPIAWLYDARSGQLISGIPRKRVNISSLAFAPNGKVLAIASEDLSGPEIDIWDLQTRTTVERFTDHKKDITRIAFSSDGRLLASGELLDGKGVVVVREVGGSRSRVQKMAAGVSALDFSRNGTLLAVGTDTGGIILLSV
jgi:WD40 repeat protein